MPLVNIHLMQGKPIELRRKMGEIVYQTVMDTINIPPKGNPQISTAQDCDSLIYNPGYLAMQRRDRFIVIQITLNEGRTTELKKNSSSGWRTFTCGPGYSHGGCLYQPGRGKAR